MRLEPVTDAGLPAPAPLSPDDLLTLQEGADLCHVNYETFRRWVMKGAIGHVLIGPHSLKFVRRRDVERQKRDVPGVDD